MALNELKSFFNQADNIKNEYEMLSKSHIQEIRMLEVRCRRMEEGHVWLNISMPPMHYSGKKRYIKVCQCCGFYCKTHSVHDTELVRKALSTEVELSPEKEGIRKKAKEEYGEKQDKLDSLNIQLNAVKKEMREIIDACQMFLGEKNDFVKQSEDDSCYWD